jgi:hypothetical protein
LRSSECTPSYENFVSYLVFYFTISIIQSTLSQIAKCLMYYLKLPINLILSSIFLSAFFPNIVIYVIFPNIVIYVPSTKNRDHVPHLYTTNGNITFLYVVIFSIINTSEVGCVVYVEPCFVFLQTNKPVVTHNYCKTICQHLR